MGRWFQSVARTRLNLFQKHNAFISSGCQLLPDRHGHCRQSLLQSSGLHGAAPFTVHYDAMPLRGVGHRESVIESLLSMVFFCCWHRFGSGVGALGLMVVPLLCSIFCGNACVTANSR